MMGKVAGNEYYINVDDGTGGIGVGIVAALEKSQGVRRKAVCVPNLNGSSKDCHRQTENINRIATKKHVFDNIKMFPATRDIMMMSPIFPTSDFLSSCHLCRKRLHGKDIYMYRGDSAFCSVECRYRQIVMDERNEKEQHCTSEFASVSSSAAHVSDSPYTYSNTYTDKANIFSTGILAI